MLHQIFQGCLQIDLMFLLTQNLESAAKSSIAELPHLLTDCGQMWAWKKILAYASRRGENSELTVHIDAWYYLRGAQSREGIYQHREEFPRRSVNCVFLVWWEIWVCACNMLTSLQPGLQRMEKCSISDNLKPEHEKTPTQIREVSNCSLLELQLNNLMVFIFTSLSH